MTRLSATFDRVWTAFGNPLVMNRALLRVSALRVTIGRIVSRLAHSYLFLAVWAIALAVAAVWL